MKSIRTAYFLWVIGGFGWLGFHRFYLGKIRTGVIWFLTGGLVGLGALVDFFTLGDQVRQYNTEQGLSTLLYSANSMGKLMLHNMNQKIQSTV
jgi:TM2 domain-containing membrane protein YozV